MPHIHTPPIDAPPSARVLWRATALAVVVAALVLLVAVLPAEYGLDPTGAGRLLGLTEMGRVKQALAAEARATTATETSAASAAAAWLAGPPGPAQNDDVTRVALAPGAAREVKLVMRAGASVTYSWSTDRGMVGYDLHGGPLDGGLSQSYRAAPGAWSDGGTLTAATDGLHGWYWRNETDTPLTVTLRTEGDYLGVARFD